MAGLLVAIGIMGVLMSVAMPSWRTVIKREKEAELLFRGQQYMRAVDLYQRRFPGAYPTDLDLLVEQRFLRRAYLDPMTGEPFRILTQGSTAAALGEATAATEDEDDRRQNRLSGRAGRVPFDAAGPGLGGRAGRISQSRFSESLGGGDDELGGIVGVVSRSPDESLLEYNGATRYDQWLFVHQPQAAVAGAPGAGGGIGVGQDGRAGLGGAAGRLDAGGLSQRGGGGDFGDRAGRGGNRMRGR
jgi:type II secretory pathway pseudopilin PulG